MKSYYKYIIGVALVTGGICLVGWRRKVANAAADFLNINEIGNNQGWSNKVFQSMMTNVGWKSGEAWCMYFVKAVYLETFPSRADKINEVLTGSTQQTWKNAKQSDVFNVITDGLAKAGDIVLWQNTSNTANGHAGIVYRKEGRDSGVVVEGNSNYDGAREGQGVVKSDRTLIPGVVSGSLKLLGFLRMKMFI